MELFVTSFPSIDCKSRSDVGMKRSYNQDNHHIACAKSEKEWLETGHILLVADGMGAHAVGEKASEQAVKVIPHVYAKHLADGAASSLRKAFQEANATIHDCGMQNSDFRGMGTTATALVIRSEGAWIGHVGDSRVYRIRGRLIEQLSYDHSLVWEYARLKKLDPDEVKEIPSNYINRCLGPEALVEPDIEGPYPIEGGDRFLLCSDGLSGLIKDPEIGALVSVLTPEQACECMVNLANLRGGHDNITVLIGAIPGSNPETISSPVSIPSHTTFWDKCTRLAKVMDFGAPWWVVSFLLGVFSACGAAAWHLNKIEYGGREILFILSVVFFVAGFIGLTIMFIQSKKAQANPDFPTPSARIHRKSEILIPPLMVEKVREQIQIFKLRANEKAWPDISWDLIQKEYQDASTFEQNKNYPMALKHFCLCWMKLTPAWIKHRREEPPIEVVWNKSAP